MFYWIQRKPKSLWIMCDSDQLNITYGKTVKIYCCPCHINVNDFEFFLTNGNGKYNTSRGLC